MVVVIAMVRARAGREGELRDAFITLVAETRKEAGCLQYDLHVALEDPASFAFYERWTDKAALDAHLASPHIAAVDALLEELGEGEGTITLYQLVE